MKIISCAFAGAALVALSLARSLKHVTEPGHLFYSDAACDGDGSIASKDNGHTNDTATISVPRAVNAATATTGPSDSGRAWNQRRHPRQTETATPASSARKGSWCVRRRW